jgi:hypothetical protein
MEADATVIPFLFTTHRFNRRENGSAAFHGGASSRNDNTL